LVIKEIGLLLKKPRSQIIVFNGTSNLNLHIT